ncbi:hypothetical protein [Pseudobacteriovorax antillogorgiicola]|uniref:Uncharacterized protein n=1 Tax=Pseudobacteriovorax antillogorgiicola TaxID=1513793 RepID=A0A1Y6C3K0_9BACT|nr:hypothetical protein [Pseudobacteriovorax antillogorgiicola]TCS49859.1 hypothetical protein EDD56_114104 [Pseudobacteriovorax antillogorgiicola]SMF43778.1 hypothetical protein SAMN06296036_113103 [Pseudobacteriovorax antillogorgiicola]
MKKMIDSAVKLSVASLILTGPAIAQDKAFETDSDFSAKVNLPGEGWNPNSADMQISDTTSGFGAEKSDCIKDSAEIILSFGGKAGVYDISGCSGDNYNLGHGLSVDEQGYGCTWSGSEVADTSIATLIDELGKSYNTGSKAWTRVERSLLEYWLTEADVRIHSVGGDCYEAAAGAFVIVSEKEKTMLNIERTFWST